MIRSLTVSCPDPFRLLDIIHADQKLYLVFEFLDVDLKRYMENGNKNGRPITPAIVKVWSPFSLKPIPFPLFFHEQALYLYACLTRVVAFRRVATRPQTLDCLSDVNITRVT